MLVNVFTPPPLSGNPVSARLCSTYPSSDPPPHLAGWLYGPGLVVLTAGKGLKCKRFLIMQKIYPPPLSHMAISTSSSMRCNIAFLPNGACLPSWARPTGQVSQMVSASPYNTAIVIFKVYTLQFLHQHCPTSRAELGVLASAAQEQPAVSTVYISPDNIVFVKHTTTTTKKCHP